MFCMKCEDPCPKGPRKCVSCTYSTPAYCAKGHTRITGIAATCPDFSCFNLRGMKYFRVVNRIRAYGWSAVNTKKGGK